MVITHHGGACFKIAFGDTSIVVNPPAKGSQFGAWRGGADIALVSLNHDDWNGAEQVSESKGKAPFIALGPGEYEVDGVSIQGFASPSKYDQKEGGGEYRNTIYMLELEGMQLCFLGAASSSKLSADARAALDEVDILFVPVGAGTLSPADAHELAVSLEPYVIVPAPLEKGALEKFLKEEGQSPKPVDKLTVKKKDLEGKEGEVVVFG